MESVLSSEFSFVAELPRATAPDLSALSRRERFHRQLATLRGLMKSKGDLLPVPLAYRFLGVSRQRVYVLLEEGKLERVDFQGVGYITADSMVAYVDAERKAGRPFKVMGNAELAKMSMEGAKEAMK